MESNIIELLRPFARMVAEELANITTTPPQQTKTRILSGINGIMDICQCSRSKAIKLKDSGILDDAITIVSARKFLINEDKAIKCLSMKKGGRR